MEDADDDEVRNRSGPDSSSTQSMLILYSQMDKECYIPLFVLVLVGLNSELMHWPKSAKNQKISLNSR